MPMPFTPGGEMCGEIEAVGTGVTGLKIGDRVATGTAGAGCYTQVVNVDAGKLVKVPKADGVAELRRSWRTRERCMRRSLRRRTRSWSRCGLSSARRRRRARLLRAKKSEKTVVRGR